MKIAKSTYTFVQKLGVIFVAMALLWLTVSAPFVMASQTEKSASHLSTDAENADMPIEEESNSNGGNSEEKTPGTGSMSEEFLHEHHSNQRHYLSAINKYSMLNAATYTSYHGELDSPPPDGVMFF